MKHLLVFICVSALIATACSSDDTGGPAADAGLGLGLAGNGGGAGNGTAGSGTAGTVAGFGVGTAGTLGTTAGTSGGAGGEGAGDAGPDADTQLTDGGDMDAASDALDAGVDAEVSEEGDAGEDAGVDAAVGGSVWPPDPATDELRDLPGDYATAICSALSTCLLPTYFEFAYDGEGCEDRIRAQLQDGEFVYLQASIDAERVVLATEKLDACYTAIAALGCNVFSSRAPAACNEAVQGVVPQGEACVIDGDCVATKFCDRSASCPGECASQRAANGACSRDDQCQTGLVCANSKCVEPAINGEDCDAGAPPCALGNLCVGADSSKNVVGMCMDQDTAFSLDADEECDPSVGHWCKDGLACIVDRKPGGAETDLIAVCKARVAEDAACHFSFAPEQCPPHQYCPADLNPSYKDDCADRPAAGQACGLFGVCAAGLRCRNDKCKAPGRLGDACAAATDCASDRCKSGECMAPARCRLDLAPPVCGDDSCDAEHEDCESCADDCGACPAMCGNDDCEEGEDCESCEDDCDACPDVCGDDTCDASETCASCADDCGACPAAYSACNDNADCGAGKKCVEKSVATLPPLPPILYGYCAEDCMTANACSGLVGQRACASNSCALQCDPVLGVFDPNRRCPLGMQCITNVCTWQQ